MIRDIKSLIEYLYLKFKSDDIQFRSVIVNPTEDDDVFGRICIINDYYDVPDLSLSSQIINRLQESPYEEMESSNPYIRGINIEEANRLFVYLKDNIYYFSSVIPDHLVKDKNCFSYLKDQILSKTTASTRLLTSENL